MEINKIRRLCEQGCDYVLAQKETMHPLNIKSSLVNPFHQYSNHHIISTSNITIQTTFGQLEHEKAQKKNPRVQRKKLYSYTSRHSHKIFASMCQIHELSSEE